MDLLRHFKTQWILSKQGNTQDAHSKSPYTKAGPLSRIKCPDLISRATFRAILPRSILIQQSCVLTVLDNRGPFRITMQCLNPWTQWNWFSNSAVFYSTIQCLQPVHGQQDTFLSRKCIHPHNKQWFKTVHEY
ncbi:hypothetical protein TNCT_403321 [Trichonephila clavata]|uniref:Uncharacterized protein n=1 Tax=Trichonephila clavata TaxID=2740835 RepID=A0A8X6LTZ9_TRICU|nr:hypothetical protein TNCT_403321 [Trichonephila clavata]